MIGKLANAAKSPEGEYTELQVLRSGGGWYIGTMFVHHTDGRSDCPGLVEPGSRESEYFASQHEALHAFHTLSWNQRERP